MKVSKLWSRRWLVTTGTVALVSFLGAWAVFGVGYAFASLLPVLLGSVAHHGATTLLGEPTDPQ